MRLSTIVLLIGVGLFVLPIPGTFIAGGIALLVGAVLRFLGE
ncbi:transporter [Halobaculum lipolyticum]|uniref:Transporter n=1 Tax=Halobaculum lipolyticum TaxID=3032001 RepID=A0ABD5WBS8_9EURY|nr:transporter [Halobaculum sp. DT31]